jgi:hypothetical protein
MTAEFDGETYDKDRDGDRLRAQLAAVRNLMANGSWFTLAQIAAFTGHPEASVSARLRDLRKPKFGGWTVERRYAGDGVWEYRAGANLTPERLAPAVSAKREPEKPNRPEWSCPTCKMPMAVTVGLDPDMGTGKCIYCKKTVTARRYA